MDESSICKAAMAAGVFNNKNLMTGFLDKGMEGNMIGSEVSFLLVAPEDHYDSCNLKGNVVSTKWLWQEWKKAKTPERIARDCSKEWTAKSPESPCPEIIKKYRQQCFITNQMEHCFGARGVKFLEMAAAPSMSPDSGVFLGKVKIVVTLASPDLNAACTTDGTQPNADDPAPGTRIDASVQLTIQGTYVVKCQAISDGTGGSVVVQRTYTVLTQSPMPTFTPNGGSGVFENLTVSMSTPDVQDTLIYFTTDGTQPSESSPLYSSPIQITRNGAVVRAFAKHPQLDTSSVATSKPFVVMARPPIIFPDGGLFVGSPFVKIEGRTGDSVFCTTDGRIPTESSTRCDGVAFQVKFTNVTLRAIAVAKDLAPSKVVVSRRFTVRAQPPQV
jgi:hypothetical protein